MKGIRVFITSLLLPFLASAQEMPHWQVMAKESRIEWSVPYGGRPITGSFPEFTADIAFDPEHLETSRVTVNVPLAKVESEDKDAKSYLPLSEWFSAKEFPTATFTASKFIHKQGDAYEAVGMLALRGKTMEVTLPFTLQFYNDHESNPPADYARVTGETTLSRLAFGVGQGEWASTDAVADNVSLTIYLEAKKVK